MSIEELLILSLFSIAIFSYIATRFYFLSSFSKFQKKYPNINKYSNVPSKWYFILRSFIYISVLCLLFLLFFSSALKPSKEFNDRENAGVDILFLVDVSLSMQSVDVIPNRLKYFKQVLLDHLDKLDGNRVGIISFSGKPFLYCPMTTDFGSLRDYIKGLGVDIVGTRGTDIGLAFSKAKEVLDSSIVFRNRIVVLVTDGENLENTKVPSFNQDTKFVIWAVGTKEGGNIVYESENGVSGYVTNQGELSNALSNPNLILSKLDLDFLKELANKNDGSLYLLNQTSVKAKQDLEVLVDSMEKNYFKRLNKVYESTQYRSFLLPIFLLLLIDFILLEKLGFWKKRVFKT